MTAAWRIDGACWKTGSRRRLKREEDLDGLRRRPS
jgi:hypothetical protein